ncbi:hypothetical protein Tco_0441217 [Tanacetum coccineum]
MDGIDIEDLTIEQYLELTQNHASSVGIKVNDMTIAEYLEYEETIKTQDCDEYQPHSAKSDASQFPIHPKITKTLSKYTKENEDIKKREQSDQDLVDIFNINAIADLGANINIMPEYILEELSLADPKNANIIVEMTDKTREVSLGIKEDMVKIKMKEQECNFTTAVSEHLNERPTSLDELSHRADSKTH